MVDITQLTERGVQISHLQAGEITSPRHHELTVRGLDTDSQDCDTVGDVQGYSRRYSLLGYRIVCEEQNQYGIVKLWMKGTSMLPKILELQKYDVHPIEYPSYIIT